MVLVVKDRLLTKFFSVGLQSGVPLAFLHEGKYDVMLASQYEYCGVILAKAAGINSVIGYTATNILPTQAISTGLPNSPNWITSEFGYVNDTRFLGNLDSDKGSLSLWGRLKRLYRWAEFSMSSRSGLIQIQVSFSFATKPKDLIIFRLSLLANTSVNSFPMLNSLREIWTWSSSIRTSLSKYQECSRQRSSTLAVLPRLRQKEFPR